MLILSTHCGEATTITTPAGETIIIRIMPSDYQPQQVLLGIEAPEAYTIQRSKIRQRIIEKLREGSIFRVTSVLHDSWTVAAETAHQAAEYYQQQYPNSWRVSTELVEDSHDHTCFELLIAAWKKTPACPWAYRTRCRTCGTCLVAG